MILYGTIGDYQQYATSRLDFNLFKFYFNRIILIKILMDFFLFFRLSEFLNIAIAGLNLKSSFIRKASAQQKQEKSINSKLNHQIGFFDKKCFKDRFSLISVIRHLQIFYFFASFCRILDVINFFTESCSLFAVYFYIFFFYFFKLIFSKSNKSVDNNQIKDSKLSSACT